MAHSPHVHVRIDLGRVRANAAEIRRLTGVAVIPVIKADAYGLGAARIAGAIAGLADSFCLFSPHEPEQIRLWEMTGKESFCIGPPIWSDADAYLAHHVRPGVSTPQQAYALRKARPVLCVDTGQQRFACPIEQVPAALREGGCDEAFTHATTLKQVRMFREAVEGKVKRMHAAGTSLLHEPEARLDAVRPGLALYTAAVRVSTKLVETHKSWGPAGYSGFVAPWHGVIVCGYSNGLRPGPCLVNGRSSQVLEVGMQTAFVQTDPSDAPGDEVVLLGDGLSPQKIVEAWGVSPQECLFRLATAGVREYVE